MGIPSKRSITGERWHLLAGMRNSVMSVTHSPFGLSAAKWCLPLSSRQVFSGASETSPAYELYLRFLRGAQATSPCSLMILRTVHSPTSKPRMSFTSGSRRR